MNDVLFVDTQRVIEDVKDALEHMEDDEYATNYVWILEEVYRVLTECSKLYRGSID